MEVTATTVLNLARELLWENEERNRIDLASHDKVGPPTAKLMTPA